MLWAEHTILYHLQIIWCTGHQCTMTGESTGILLPQRATDVRKESFAHKDLRSMEYNLKQPHLNFLLLVQLLRWISTETWGLRKVLLHTFCRRQHLKVLVPGYIKKIPLSKALIVISLEMSVGHLATCQARVYRPKIRPMLLPRYLHRHHIDEIRLVQLIVVFMEGHRQLLLLETGVVLRN